MEGNEKGIAGEELMAEWYPIDTDSYGRKNPRFIPGILPHGIARHRALEKSVYPA